MKTTSLPTQLLEVKLQAKPHPQSGRLQLVSFCSIDKALRRIVLTKKGARKGLKPRQGETWLVSASHFSRNGKTLFCYPVRQTKNRDGIHPFVAQVSGSNWQVFITFQNDDDMIIFHRGTLGQVELSYSQAWTASLVFELTNVRSRCLAFEHNGWWHSIQDQVIQLDRFERSRLDESVITGRGTIEKIPVSIAFRRSE